jgi:hypothetical protein
MNTQHELAAVNMALQKLGRQVLAGTGTQGVIVIRLAVLADQVSLIAQGLRPERKRLTWWRRAWFLATRRAVA